MTYILTSVPLHLPDVPHAQMPDPPLKAVLGQVRFPAVLRIQEPEFMAPFQDAIRREYPTFGHQQEIGVLVGPRGVVQTSPVSAWRFSDATGTWHVVLGTDFLTVEATAANYTQFGDLRERLRRAVETLVAVFGVAQATRLGLRYVNHIGVPGEDPIVACRRLIRPELLGAIGVDIFADELSATLSDVRLARPDGTLIIKHGLVQAGEPAQPGYLLDFDYFTENPMELAAGAEALHNLDGFHDVLYRLFHWSITDEARRDFGAVELEHE
jgi:uncharacterized protein (TIGR04255 family)